MKCYNCGAKLGRENICPECGVNVKIYKKIVMASNEYYNDALARRGSVIFQEQLKVSKQV